MKRYLLLSLIIFAFASAASAQSMTDSQIISFVQKEQKAGTSQAQIVTKLMQKGVTVDQIRRIRKQYEGMKSSNASGMTGVNGDASNRSRSNNTDYGTDDEDYTDGEYSNYRVQSSRRKTRNYGEDRKTMRDELDEFVPDSNTIKKRRLRKEVEEEMHKKVFGRDIFNNEELSFEPNMNIATPQNYRLGPGDVVFIDVYGASQKSMEYTISPDGEVVVEGYGPIQLSGLSVSEANARLRSSLGSRYRSSSVKLTVGQTRTIMVNVMGEVKAPGTYTLSAFATVFHALYMAGGTNDLGTLRNIKVYRNSKLVSVVDIYDYILNGKLTGNVRLADNDVIVVGPYDCLVSIDGKVKRPMFYEMKKNESLQTLLKYAGGFTGDAYKKSVRVQRKTGREYSVFNVNEFDMSSFRIADGDSVSVDSIMQRYSNTVEIRGAVFRPGMYQLGRDITTVRSLLNYAEGLKEEAFTTRAVMHRMKKDRTLEVVSLDIDGIMNGTSPDVPLKENDVIFIPTKQEMMTDRTITIHGEVQYPGVYKYADNETVEDFILQAGGLKESASVKKVDITRRVSNPYALTTDSMVAKTFSVQIKDGFIIDGEPGFTLMPFDEVFVRKSPGYSDPQTITVEGEVAFAGDYTLTKRETRLSDVIKAAGGVNQRAYVSGARLVRQVNEYERERMLDIIKTEMKATGKDSTEIKNIEIAESYPVGIELDKALANPGCAEDIVLRDGDIINVPLYNSTVKINGEVMYPNTVAYKKGKGLKYYINQAGGYGTQAKRSNTYIIYMNGDVAKANASAKILPGCEIVVPSKPKRDASRTTQNLAIASGVASLGVMVATIANILKK